jgi:hypothetical protein
MAVKPPMDEGLAEWEMPNKSEGFIVLSANWWYMILICLNAMEIPKTKWSTRCNNEWVFLNRFY